MADFFYGYKPDPEDQRDYMFSATYAVEELPAQADHLIHMPPVRDQSQMSSCTGFAERTQLEHMQRFKGEMWEISPLFIYNMARIEDGTFPSDGGSYLRTACKVAAKYGVPKESDFPYDLSKVTLEPPPEVKSKALGFKSLRYERIQVAPQYIQSAIWRGFTVVAGITVKSSFESQQVASSGMVPYPQPDEPTVGGHAFVIHGYDNTRKTLEGDLGMYHCQNSWGTGWGENGHFWMPYHYIHNYALTGDLWAVYEVSP